MTISLTLCLYFGTRQIETAQRSPFRRRTDDVIRVDVRMIITIGQDTVRTMQQTFDSLRMNL